MTIFTGIQPSGVITLGNYLGSIKNFKTVNQKEGESFFCIVDQHALTVTPKTQDLFENSKKLAALYIAMDLHKEANIFMQSTVSGHSELGWILECHAKLGELERMTQFKDKSQKNISVSTGLFTYPVLMAADILLYKTTHVPVGIDQKQHLELARDLASRFNSFYEKDVFVIPEPEIQEATAKIYSLTEPEKKMSKSDENSKSFISMLDTPKQIEKKIKSATTDSVGVINYDPDNQPGVSNLLVIYMTCKEITMEETLKHFENQGYGFLKQEVAQAVIDEIAPIQEKYNEIYSDEDKLKEILNQGKIRANEIASKTLREVKQTIGYLM